MDLKDFGRELFGADVELSDGDLDVPAFLEAYKERFKGQYQVDTPNIPYKMTGYKIPDTPANRAEYDKLCVEKLGLKEGQVISHIIEKESVVVLVAEDKGKSNTPETVIILAIFVKDGEILTVYVEDFRLGACGNLIDEWQDTSNALRSIVLVPYLCVEKYEAEPQKLSLSLRNCSPSKAVISVFLEKIGFNTNSVINGLNMKFTKCGTDFTLAIGDMEADHISVELSSTEPLKAFVHEYPA